MAEQHSLTEDYETPYKFNGKELDAETGFYYYGARYYNPRVSVWLSVDPLMEKSPNVNPFIYCVQNPVRMIDPDGNSPKDIIHVNKDGIITKVTDDGSPIITIIDGDKIYKPSTLDSKILRNRQIMANVGAYYRNKMGINSKYKVAAGGNPEGESSTTNPAFTTGSLNQITFNTNGGFSQRLDNKYNLESVILHEHLHQLDNESGKVLNFSTHANVYINQINDSSFKSTEKSFQISMLHGLGNYILNMDRSSAFGTSDVWNILDYFNSLGTGYKLNYSPTFAKGNLSLYVTHGDKVYSAIEFKPQKN